MIILKDSNTGDELRVKGSSFPSKGGDIYSDEGHRLSVTQVSWRLHDNELIPVLPYINTSTSKPFTGTDG